MKKSLSQAIALATLVGGAAAAQAVEVNHEGIGGALLYPLYSVQGSNTTDLSVTNTSDDFKAVKIRFVEAQNSAEVLDFHLYMSPQDVWTGALVPTETGARLVTKDTSCIAGITGKDGKQIKPLNFSSAQIELDEMGLADPASPNYNKDFVASTAEQLANRVKVGHFEVIEMATVTNPDLQAAIKHKDGVPGDCTAITEWWTSDLKMGTGTDRENRVGNAGDLSAPTGGLYGNAAIVNVKEGWAASYDAVALVDDLAAGTNFYTDIQHPRPGSIYPHLASVLNGANVEPDDTRLDAVTEALRLASVYNSYYVDPALGASTDLVVTFPTKRFYTFEAKDLDTNALAYKYGGTDNPFDEDWDDVERIAPVAFDATIYDREEEMLTVKAEDGFVSPRPIEKDASIALNWEANVISLSETSDSFGAAAAGVRTEVLTKNDEFDFTAGWIQITRSGGEGANEDSVPAIGFANIVTKNGVSADGAMRNFAQTFKNKTVSK